MTQQQQGGVECDAVDVGAACRFHDAVFFVRLRMIAIICLVQVIIPTEKSLFSTMIAASLYFPSSIQVNRTHRPFDPVMHAACLFLRMKSDVGWVSKNVCDSCFVEYAGLRSAVIRYIRYYLVGHGHVG